MTVLRQAWNDRLRPILVINKVDRLVTELRLTPNEAYHHLVQLIEQVNAVMGSFFAAERMEDDLRWREDREKRINARKEKQEEDAVNAASSSAGNDDADPEYEEHDDEDIYFDPSRGNVIFGSAIDNWAFRLERFSVLYAKKLGIQESRFRKVLWGDYYFDTKNKRVIGQKQREKEKRNLKPMFVQFVLDNIWAVYDSIVLNRDQEKIEKIVKTLELKILPRDLKSKDHSGLLSAVFSQWLPLASCTFSAVVSNIPSPKEAQALRIPKLLQPGLSYFAADKELEPQTEVQRDMYTAKPGQDAFKVAYVSKMFAVKREDLPEGRRKNLTAEEMRARAKDSRERARAIQAATGAQVNGDAEHQTSNGMSLEEAQAQAEAAARRIKADTLLVKVAALYHDIGKTKNPEYFIENQSGYNPHEGLSPKESAAIIIGHVEEGVRLAKKAGIPSLIIDFIQTHHGTTSTAYFLHKHLENGGDKGETEDFAYPGPRPRSKEEAILMMADSIEAAGKSLDHPTEQELYTLIDKIIDGKLRSGQFRDSLINFRELEQCRLVFRQIMKSVHHVRVAYPDQKEEE